MPFWLLESCRIPRHRSVGLGASCCQKAPTPRYAQAARTLFHEIRSHSGGARMPTPSGASRPGDAAPGKPSRARPPRWRFGASRGTPLSPRRRRRRRVGATITVLIIGSALGFGWLLLSHWQSSSNEAALSELRVQSQRLHHFDTLHMQLMAAESGVRGYFLSGDPMYLTALQESRFESELVLRGLAE